MWSTGEINAGCISKALSDYDGNDGPFEEQKTQMKPPRDCISVKGNGTIRLVDAPGFK